MSWQIAIGFSILANIATTLVQRRYSLKSKAPATFPSAASYLLGVVPVGLIVGFSLPHQIYWSQQLAVLLFICAASMAISGWIGFMAVKLMPVAPYQTIGKFTIFVAVALGWIVLNERLTFYQLVGALIILLAAVLAIYAPILTAQDRHRHLHILPVFMTLVSATFLAFGLVSEKAILGHMQLGGVLILGWGAQTIAMLLLALKDANKHTIQSFKLYEIKWSTFMGLANGITGAFYVYALNKSDNISLITTLTAVALPLSALGAHFLLDERENSKLMWLSIIICFAGLIIMSL